MSLEVFRSSAGSGKTTTLVKAYLHLVLNPQAEGYHSILAITFSNKAANELKIRIVESLAQIANVGSPDELKSAAGIFWKEFAGFHPNHTFDQVKSKAVQVLRSILHRYGIFSVSTIDRFTHRLIRSFSFDLQLPSNFVVDLDTKKIVRDATLDLLNLAGKDDQLTRVLTEFLSDQFDLEKSSRLEEPISALHTFIYNDEGLPKIQSFQDIEPSSFLKIRRELLEVVREHKAGMANLAKKALELINNQEIPYAEFSQKGEIPKMLNEVIDGQWISLELNRKRASDCLVKGNFFSKDKIKSSPELIDRIRPIEFELKKLGEELVHYNKSNLKWVFTCEALSANIYTMAVMGAIRRIIISYRSTDSKLGIAEFNHLVSTAIASQPAPYILERVGERYSHIMIDEFQDTSLLQWQNLVPLAENCLSQGGNVLLVGDVKQSIYRFRGAEAKQLNELPFVPDASHKSGKRKIDVLQDDFKHRFLQSNYRSAEAIVSFNNYFFKQIVDDLPQDYVSIREFYTDVYQEITRLDISGSVSLCDVDSSLKEPMSEADHIARVLDVIHSYLRSGIRYGDITLLFRSNKEIVKLATALWEAGIPMVSSESLNLGSSSRVGFLMAYYKWILFGKQEIHRIEWMLELCRCFNKNADELELFLHEKPAGKSLEAEFNLAEYVADLTGMTAYALFNDLIDLVGWDVSGDAFLSTFLDWVLENSTDADYDSLVENWNLSGYATNIVLPEGRDAVTLMTIHKAKGLEFDVVIMPFADWSRGSQTKKIWAQVDPDRYFGLTDVIVNNNAALDLTEFAEKRALEKLNDFFDDLNLLYVAMTRPKKHLFMMVRSASKATSNTRKYLMDALKDGDAHPDFHNTVVWGTYPTAIRDTVEIKQPSEVKTNFMAGPINSAINWTFSSVQPAALQDEQRFGIAMHEALLFSLKPDEYDQRLLELSVLYSGQANYLKRVSAWFHSEELKSYWDGEGTLYIEQTLLDTDGSLHRPDRMRVHEGNVMIWDLKTGEERDSDRKQVERYADLLKRMNYSIKGAYILYTQMQHCIQVI